MQSGYPFCLCAVAPLAGARIEIVLRLGGILYRLVAPLAGARIEIAHLLTHMKLSTSLPSRERGLK